MKILFLNISLKEAFPQFPRSDTSLTILELIENVTFISRLKSLNNKYLESKKIVLTFAVSLVSNSLEFIQQYGRKSSLAAIFIFRNFLCFICSREWPHDGGKKPKGMIPVGFSPTRKCFLAFLTGQK